MKSKLVRKVFVTYTCLLLLYCNEKGIMSLWLSLPKLKKRIFVTCNHYEICTIFGTSKDDLLQNAFDDGPLGGTSDTEIDEGVF